jgi:hypothetical protein
VRRRAAASSLRMVSAADPGQPDRSKTAGLRDGAASSAHATPPIPAETTGYSIPKRSQIRVFSMEVSGAAILLRLAVMLKAHRVEADHLIPAAGVFKGREQWQFCFGAGMPKPGKAAMTRFSMIKGHRLRSVPSGIEWGPSLLTVRQLDSVRKLKNFAHVQG